MKIFRNEELTPDTPLTRNEKEWVYNALDVCVTLEVWERQRPQLDDVASATYVFSHSLMAPILEMTMRGVRIDEVARIKVLTEFKSTRTRVEENLRAMVEEGVGVTPFNYRSDTQVKNLFYNVMGYKPILALNKSTGRYVPTVNRDALEKLERHFALIPLVRHMMVLRELDKKIQFLETDKDADGRMRTNYNIAGTGTGRLSSSESDYGTGTNQQNIERKLRRIIIPDEGMKLCNVDLEQADSRHVGAICWELFVEQYGEKWAGAYLDACESGDLHTYVAKLAYTNLEWPEDRALWRKVADQTWYREFSYRDGSKGLGHGCLTEDHEVLTPSGWVSISEQPPVIMQWQETKSTWASVEKWTCHEYAGSLQSYEGNSLSALMTHDHRVPYKLDQQGPIRERAAEQGPGKLMPLGSGFVGGSLKSHGRLIAAIMSDGHVSGNRTRFNLRKERKIRRLHKLCKEANVDIKRYRDGTYSIGFSWRKSAGPWVLELSRDTALDLLDEYSYWDGTVGASSVTLYAKDRTHLEWLQTLGRLYGIGGNISKPYTSGFGSTVYRLQQNKRQYASGSSIVWGTQKFEGLVYCPTVSTGWFYVRRNGKIFVTGNTNFFGTPRTMAQHAKVATKLIEDFQRNYFEAFPVIGSFDRDPKKINWHNRVRADLATHGNITTPFYNRRRFFYGRPEDDATLRKAIAYGPQSMTADAIDTGLLNLKRSSLPIHLLIQVHDSITFQYPEYLEDRIIPQVLDLLTLKFELKKGREFFVPVEAKIGFNWADADEDNEFGLVKWKGPGMDKRSRPKVLEAKKPGFNLQGLLDAGV